MESPSPADDDQLATPSATIGDKESKTAVGTKIASALAVTKPATTRTRCLVDWSDKGAVLWRVRKFRGNLEFASEPLRDDEDVVLTAVRKDGMSLQFASTRLCCVKKVALDAVKQNGLALEHVGNALQNDADVVLAAVENNGLALQFATKRLRKNALLLRKAVANNGSALRHGLPPAVDAFKVQKSAAIQVEKNRLRKPVSFFLDLKRRPGMVAQLKSK